jgi:hypothetical protein
MEEMFVFNALRNGWLLSFGSPPFGEITQRQAGVKIVFSTALLSMARQTLATGGPALKRVRLQRGDL